MATLKNDLIQVKISSEFKNIVESIADERHVTMSDFIRNAIQEKTNEYLEEKAQERMELLTTWIDKNVETDNNKAFWNVVYKVSRRDREMKFALSNLLKKGDKQSLSIFRNLMKAIVK